MLPATLQPDSQPPARPRRWRRRLGRALLALALLVVAAVLALALLARNLDRPWVKRRVQLLVRRSVGVDIDYAGARARLLSGLDVDDLVIAAAPADRRLTPAVARIGRLEARWTPSSLTRRAKLTRLTLDDVALAVVVDERGSSLDRLLPPAPGPQPPASPTSRVVADLLAAPPAVAQLEVTRARVTVLRSVGGRVAETDRVDGLSLALAFGAGRLDVAAGSAASPLALHVARQRDGAPAGSAEAQLWLTLAATAGRADATVDARVIRQTLAPAVPIDRLLHAELSARFDSAAGVTTVELAHAELADGAATIDARLRLSDGADDPLLAHAAGHADLGRLAVLAPAGLVPATLRRGSLRFGVDGLRLALLPRLEPGGTAALDAAVDDVRVAAGGGARLSSGHVALDVHPGPGGALAVHGTAALRGVDVGGAAPLAFDRADLGVDGALAAGGAFSGDVTAHLGALDLGGALRLAVAKVELAVRADGLVVDAAAPLATRGQLALHGRIAALDAGQRDTHAAASGLALTGAARLAGGPPYAVDLDVPVARLRLTGARGRLLADGPARLALRLSDAVPDAARPLRSRGVAHVTAALGDLHAALDATKAADAVDFKLAADARSLAAARLLVPATAPSVPWEKVGLTLRSSGRLTRLGAAPELRQHSELTLTHPALRSGPTAVAADAVTLVVSSTGSTTRQSGDSELRFDHLRVGDDPLGSGTLTLAAAVDLAAASLRLQLATSGDAAPRSSVRATVGFERGRRALTYDFDAKLAQLGALAPLFATRPGLAAFDLSKLELAFAGRGALLGLVSDVGRDGTVHFVRDPLATLAAEGTLRAGASHLGWAQGDRALRVRQFAWHATLATDGKKRTLASELTVDALHFGVGPHALDVRGVDDSLTGAISGDLRLGAAQLSQRLAVATLHQDFAPGYLVGNLQLLADGRRDADGVVRVDRVDLTNQAAGTALHLEGALEVANNHKRLALRGELHQDLARLWAEPQVYAGSGALALRVRIESGDLRVFHTLAVLAVDGAHARLPRARVAVEGADGEVPITADLRLGKRGVRLLRGGDVNPYSELRFADQHPLLSRPSFLKIASITTPFISIAPLAGNLSIDQNVVSLSQFEMGVRGGRITGQCVINWSGPTSTVAAHVRAAGVQSSHGEPFDGNAELFISAKDHSVDGRAEILRIGRRHLKDLLDLEDPHRVDPGMNRIRRALAFGYPDRLRLAFDHGFASLKITMGGLARLIHIDDVRGIPMGPLVDKLLAPVTATGAEEEP